MRYFNLFILLLSISNICAQSWEPVSAGITRPDSGYDAVMALYPFHGKLYIGGKFIYSGKRKMNSLACWNGIKIDTVGRGLDSIVSAFTEYNGELCIGGGFYKRLPERKRAANIVLWNDSTGAWTAMGRGLESCTTCPLSPVVEALYTYNRELYAGGNFWMRYSDNSSFPIAKWNGNDWSKIIDVSKNATLMGTGTVNAIMPYYSKLYIGSKTIFDNKDENSIVTFDGRKIEVVGNGLNKGDRHTEDGFSHPCTIEALAVYEGSLYAGGYFDSAGGKRLYSIAKWNDTNWSTIGAGIKGIIYAMAVYDGKLYAGGTFDSAGGKPALNIAVWDGNTWSAVGEGLEAKRRRWFRGRVTALAVYNNELYAGGTFDFSGKTSLSNLARLNLKASSKSPVKKK